MIVALLFGYHKDAIYDQSIYTAFKEIKRKIPNYENIINIYSSEIHKLNYFKPAKSNFKWLIDKEYSDEDMSNFLTMLKKLYSK